MSAPIPILLYFLLLLPSAGILLAGNDLMNLRRDISFNLSGPFTLMISAWFFSRQTLSRQTILRLFAALIAPLIGIAAITLYTTFTAPDILFLNESNLTTSGGFGPNQVSAMLGAGALLCFVCLLEGSVSRKIRLVVVGALNTVLGAKRHDVFARRAFHSFYQRDVDGLILLKDRRARIRLLVLGGLLFIFGGYVVLPKLDEFTRGYLITRFRNTAPTRRDEIVADDLRTWEANPVFGVGPGQAKFRHQSFRRNVAAHTEYSRLVAEHGIFGFAALVLLIIATLRTIISAGSTLDRVVKVMVVSWSLLFMLGDAMRLAAPAFLLGLAFATLFPEAMKLKERYRLRWPKYLPERPDSETLPAVDVQS